MTFSAARHVVLLIPLLVRPRCVAIVFRPPWRREFVERRFLLVWFTRASGWIGRRPWGARSLSACVVRADEI